MWQTIASGLGLAAISALTVTAYKHHDGYMRLLKAFRIVLTVSFLAVVFWETAASRTYFALYDFIDKGKLSDASKALEGLKLLNLPVFIGYCVAIGYFEFLAFLPELLADKKTKDPKH